MPQLATKRTDGMEDSRAAQDYVKAIYKLQAEVVGATTLALALRLRVKPASVTEMVKRLADDPGGPFLTHTPYHGVALTARGEALAPRDDPPPSPDRAVPDRAPGDALGGGELRGGSA